MGPIKRGRKELHCPPVAFLRSGHPGGNQFGPHPPVWARTIPAQAKLSRRTRRRSRSVRLVVRLSAHSTQNSHIKKPNCSPMPIYDYTIIILCHNPEYNTHSLYQPGSQGGPPQKGGPGDECRHVPGRARRVAEPPRRRICPSAHFDRVYGYKFIFTYAPDPIMTRRNAVPPKRRDPLPRPFSASRCPPQTRSTTHFVFFTFRVKSGRSSLQNHRIVL